jgi:5-methylcytosine-specific restriction endonuclease McrA
MSRTKWNKEAKDRKRLELEQRDGRVCGICGDPIAQDEQPTLDHITPLAFGGSKRRLDNLQLAHSSCNWKRGHIGAAKKPTI